MTHLLGFTPLIDPITALAPGIEKAWLLLLVPLIIGICVVYKGTRVRTTAEWPRAAGKLVAQVFLVMAVAAVAIDVVYVVVTRLL